MSETEEASISHEDIRDIRRAFEAGGVPAVMTLLKHKLDEMSKTKLDIAVIGEPTVGKSVFINSILQLGKEEDICTNLRTSETNKLPSAYCHPKFNNVKFWDLPGIGSPNFAAVSYLRKIRFHYYDLFIIMSSNVFNIHHANLAMEIKKRGRSFCFVRSKVDADLLVAKAYRQYDYNEWKVLQEIRNNCIGSLQKVGIYLPTVFLLSSFQLEKFDFPVFCNALLQELPGNKQYVLLLALPVVTLSSLEGKKKLLKTRLHHLCFLSSAVATLPTSGLSVVVDINILVREVQIYCTQLGLDDASLSRLSQMYSKPLHTLKAMIKCPEAKASSAHEIKELLLTRAEATLLLGEEFVTQLMPVVGPAIAGSMSFYATHKALNEILNDLLVDAEHVILTALKPERLSGSFNRLVNIT
ncbi:interferon-inducible GTPase 5-like [Protopterus annectens]|uniref:interferon-inducible GTPase 5-like n=1 Tax=Protopterus annectens TaxID=7888 RepID=UPI001CFC2BB9|nr:interferon-inducible GTPase 5-like [Protopterus annectens]XP_043936494.1 interferon-inducible GTPase 5-like [Protopterus annectens]